MAETGLITLDVEKTKLECLNNIIKPLLQEKATIRVYVAEHAQIQVFIYDTNGNQKKEILSEEKDPGVYINTWDGTDESGAVVGSGTYMVHMRTKGFSDTKKIVVIK